jgi:CHAD domain-containing protein
MAEEREPEPSGAHGRALVGYLRAQRDAVVALEPPVRRDEPDAVHRMRVATRRLRTALRTFRPLVHPAAAGLRDELAWLAGLLGVIRDAEVTAAAVDRALAAEPPELVVGPVRARVLGELRRTEARGRTVLLAALDGDRYGGLLASLGALAAQPLPDPAAATDRAVLRRVGRAVAAADWLLIRAASNGAGFDPSPRRRWDGGGRPSWPLSVAGESTRDVQLHEARKATKRARYAVEAVLPAAGTPARRLIDRLTAVQELLGAHHDTVSAREQLRRWALRAQAAGENAFSYGLLHGRQGALAERLEADLPATVDAATHPRDRRFQLDDAGSARRDRGGEQGSTTHSDIL